MEVVLYNSTSRRQSVYYSEVRHKGGNTWYIVVVCYTTGVHLKRVLGRLYVGMAPTRPLSLNKSNSSELSNAAAISPFRHIMWPTSVSIDDNTLKGGKICHYNDIHEIAKTPISPSPPSNGLVQNWYKYLPSKGFLFPCAVPFTNGIFMAPLLNE